MAVAVYTRSPFKKLTAPDPSLDVPQNPSTGNGGPPAARNVNAGATHVSVTAVSVTVTAVKNCGGPGST